MDHELGVFIGRFQIFHTRHLGIILDGLKNANKVAVMIGSSNAARSYRNPFLFSEREEMILKSVEAAGEDISRIVCFPLEDIPYNDKVWKQTVVSNVEKLSSSKPVLLGYKKDYTGYFLEMFPEWDRIPAIGDGTSSTYMRNIYFSNIGDMWAKHSDGNRQGDSERDKHVPTPVREFLMTFLDTPEYRALYDEYEYITKYHKPFLSLPYTPVFKTADAVVTHGTKVLLVKRKNYPGKGLWACPGGFVKESQTVKQAMLDELHEETCIQVTKENLEKQIAGSYLFDEPHRDPRGRIITTGYHVKLKASTKLPEIHPADDAQDAQWWEIDDLTRPMMMSDHLDIINKLVKGV
jgi:bifunctional NMN adenylyltransferase/nudix hydrolase